MPTPPYAILTVSVNGGAAQTGGITVTAGDTLDFRLENTTGVIKQKFEIYDYPTGFPQPAGWSVDANGVYYYTTDTTPPQVTTSTWGKLMCRVRINDMVDIGTTTDEADANLFDEGTAISVPSGAGFVDLGCNETNQFSSPSWIKEWQKDLRLMAAGGLSAPANPADDDKLAFAAAGTLDYADGIKVLNPGGAQDGLELTEIDSPAATDLTLKGTGGEVKIDCAGAAIRAQFSGTAGRGLEIYKAGGTTEWSATDFDRLAFATQSAVAIGYSVSNTTGVGSQLSINGQAALAASVAAGGKILINTGTGDGTAAPGAFEVDLGSVRTLLAYRWKTGTPGSGFGVDDATAGGVWIETYSTTHRIFCDTHPTGAGLPFTITGQAAGGVNTAGGTLGLAGGTGDGSAIGGAVSAYGGAGGSTGTGGSATVAGGTGGAGGATGHGGAAYLSGGAAGHASANGGLAQVKGGNGGGAGTGGNVQLQGGTGATPGTVRALDSSGALVAQFSANALTLGNNSAFTIGRTAHTSGAGVQTWIYGQAAFPTSGMPGGTLFIYGGAGDGAGAGGQAALTGGAAGATGDGGSAGVWGGAGGASAGNGGAAYLQGGAALANNDDGGHVIISPGSKHGAGTDGSTLLRDAAGNNIGTITSGTAGWGDTTNTTTTTLGAATTAYVDIGATHLVTATATLLTLNGVSGADTHIDLNSSGAGNGNLSISDAICSNWQSGQEIIFIGDCTAAPTGNPASGGFMYSTGGAGTWRGSGGTITTFGPAEPECPRCGRDHVLSAHNPDKGWRQTICLTCLKQELDKLGIDRAAYLIHDEG